jgi:tetratricopeptide (TPR) repeat protein
MKKHKTVRLWLIALALGLAFAVTLPTWAGTTETDPASTTTAAAKKKKKKKRKKAVTTQQAASADEEAEGLSPAASRALAQIDNRLEAWNTADAKRLVGELSGVPDAEVAIARGRVAQQEKDWSTARAELERAAKASPEDPEPLVFLGETLLLANDQGGARQAFARAADVAQARLADSADDVDALYSLGISQQRMMRFDDAFATLSRARQGDSSDAMIVYQLGVTRAFQERWSEAATLLDQAIAMNSGIAYAYYYRGLSEGRAGHKDRLVNDLNRFLAMAPHSPDAAKAKKILESV